MLSLATLLYEKSSFMKIGLYLFNFASFPSYFLNANSGHFQVADVDLSHGQKFDLLRKWDSADKMKIIPKTCEDNLCLDMSHVKTNPVEY